MIDKRVPLPLYILLLALVGTSCRGVTTVRMGEPVALQSGPARNECEAEDWYELVPAQSFSSGADETGRGYGWVEYTTISRSAPGYAVFRPGEDSPEELKNVFPKMNEPALEQAHMQRIDGILSRESRSRNMVLWGGVAAIGSAILMGATWDSEALSWTFGIATFASLGVMLWGAVSQPSASERTFANLRKTTLLPDEDNLTAAQRGVNHANQTTRSECGGGGFRIQLPKKNSGTLFP